MNRQGSLENQIAIVTGSRRGIGKAIALTFAEAGADVALCALTDDEKLKAVTEQIRQIGRRSLSLGIDVTKRSDVEYMAQRVINEFGSIDILVNCAGLWITGQTLLECGEDDWDRVVNTNLKSTYLFCQAAGKRMVEQKTGNIINITSRVGINATPGIGAYGVAKAGVILLTQQLALEMAGYNIRVNAIAPGWIKTDMNVHLRTTPEAEKHISDTVPLGRLGETEDISKIALFLASDDAGFVTGQTIVADGGGRVLLSPE